MCIGGNGDIEIMEKECKYCNEKFTKKYNESKKYFESKLYCSKNCYTNSMKGIDILKENRFDGIVWNKDRKYFIKDREILICKNCKIEYILDMPHRINKSKYCSHKCSSDDRILGNQTEIQMLRGSWKYKVWRKSVFERDNYTCVLCGVRGGTLNADHIKPFSTFEDLRFDLDNGRTLCLECHKNTDTFGSKSWRFKNKLIK